MRLFVGPCEKIQSNEAIFKDRIDMYLEQESNQRGSARPLLSSEMKRHPCCRVKRKGGLDCFQEDVNVPAHHGVAVRPHGVFPISIRY